MDLVASIRKQGSRGGVNFNWEDVTTSAHRENYLGHSLKAPVGRWQKGRDLSWYAKADAADSPNETAEERAARERKEELKKIKEAEEDALARALGLPIAQRNVTGANAVDVSQPRMAQQTDSVPEAEGSKANGKNSEASRHHRDTERRHRRRHRSRSRDPDRRGHRREHDRDRDRRRSRSPPGGGHGTHRARSREGRDDRHIHRRRSDSREQEVHRPRNSRGRDERKGRSIGEFEDRRGRRDNYRSTSRDRRQARRSKSPEYHRRRGPGKD